MQVVDPFSSLPWWGQPAFWTAIATLVIACATIWYVIISKRLWQATKDSAESARKSAEAAQISAESARAQFEAAHRPYFAVAEVAVPPGAQELTVIMKNYGTVPLSFGAFEIEAIEYVPSNLPTAPMQFQGKDYRKKFTAKGEGLVLPQETETFYCGLDYDWLYELIRDGSARLRIEIRFRYRSIATQKEYTFRSVQVYNAQKSLFMAESSSMD